MLRSAVSGGGIKAGACRLRRDGEKLCTVGGGMGGEGEYPTARSGGSWVHCRERLEVRLWRARGCCVERDWSEGKEPHQLVNWFRGSDRSDTHGRFPPMGLMKG